MKKHKVSDVRIKKKGMGYVVMVGKTEMTYTQSLKQAKVVAGAHKRLIIKRALKEAGVKKMPRSLSKISRGGYGNY